VPVTPAAPAALPAPCPIPSTSGARFEACLAARPAPPPPPPPAARLAETLRSLEASQVRLDRVLHAARAGRTFTAGELLALQSDAHRFGQTLDVAAKLVEHGVQAVKQAVNTQV
jgi:hypothetical protein